jgi:dUTP pyrophosphatase
MHHDEAFVYAKLLRSGTTLPQRSYGLDAGWDVFATEEIWLEPGGTQDFKMGWCLELPVGYFLMVCSRSGLATKHGIVVPGSPLIADAGYRGEYVIWLKNIGPEQYRIQKNSAIAQLVLMKHSIPIFKVMDKLSPSERGERGFGSSG